MAERNLGVLKIARTPLKVIPEYKILKLDVGEDEPLEVKLYVKGPGQPTRIDIAETEAYAEREEAMPTAEERAALKSWRFVLRSNKADYQWRIDLLQAVTDNALTDDQAQVLAHDDGPWRNILVESGYLEALTAAQEADANPEAQGETASASGQTDSPVSAPTTADTTP